MALDGVFNFWPVSATQAALSAVRDARKGTIINVASFLTFSAGIDIPQIPPRSLYAAVKAAAVAFSRTLALEFAGAGILVQVTCPGVPRPGFPADSPTGCLSP